MAIATIAPACVPPDRRRSARTDWPARLTGWTIWLLVAGSFVNEVLGQTEVVSFGFYTFHAVDPAVFVAAIACAGQLLRGRLAWHVFTPPIIVVALLICLNFVRGMSVDGAAALLWFRANGAIAFVLLLAVTMTPSARAARTVTRALVLYSVLASVLFVLREATHPTLFMTADVSDFDANDGGRSLSVGAAFLMTLTSGLLLAEILRRPRFVLDWRAGFAFVLPLLVALTGQGTASICEIVMILAVLLMQRGPSRNVRFVLVAGALLAAPVILAAIVSALQGNDFLLHRAGNYETRRAVWDALMSVFPSQSALDQTIGFPGGQRPVLYVPTSQGFKPWEASIHSMYYGALPMMGYLGAACFVLILGGIAIVAAIELFVTRRLRSAFPLAACVATAILANSYEVRGADLIGLFYAICLIRAAREAMPARTGSGLAAAGRAGPLHSVRTVKA